ncbi:similar to Saccharomyces cerevisiae YFR046C CNN1 Kinetochore protein of unknown function [Maudiozyma saulgeensis]|uniref:Uncharacterized protein n=1 Tax=Maudiozyma saulgeensis TaxID=1789683 RepID=A0A1X7RAU0_9SACH|nr:similar to Saccharomyces cerevisiae YFR046C CNN1 Kinetochore protein of unknown function [Kazachstania saulgeensis]
MEIKSPSKSSGSLEPSESVILTPFKERALEEQRLRDSLILSWTPSLKRQSEVQTSVVPLNNDIAEIRSYLQDLSSALASRGEGKNLTSQLLSHTEEGHDSSTSFNNDGKNNNLNDIEQLDTAIHETSFNNKINTFNNVDDSLLVQEINELSDLTREIPSENLIMQSDLGSNHSADDFDGNFVEPSLNNDSPNVEKVEIEKNDGPMTLSQQILSRIPRQRSGTKIRKLEPVHINGVTNPSISDGATLHKGVVKNPFVTEAQPQREAEPELESGSEPGLINYNDQGIPETFDIDMEPNLPHIPESPESDTHENHITNLVSGYGELPQKEYRLPNSPYFEYNEGFHEPTTQTNIIPIGTRQLHDLFDNYLIMNNIKLKEKSWKTLQEISSQLLGQISTSLDNGNGLIVPHRTKIIEMLQNHEIIPLNATDSDIYGLCSSYLTVEEMNELEMEWFS